MAKLGYIPIDAVNRKIQSAPGLDNLFPKADLSEKIILRDANAENTVRAMAKLVNSNYGQTKKLAERLNGKSTFETCKNIYEFVVKHLKYNKEEGELLRTPSRSWHDGQVMARQYPNNKAYSIDCDCMAIFVASILKNLGIKYHFIITSYLNQGKDNGWQHVYVLVPVNNGQSYIKIDPVYFSFNQQKQFNHYKIFDMNGNELQGIPVSVLSGTGAVVLQTAKNWIAKNPGKSALIGFGVAFGIALAVSPNIRKKVKKLFK